MKSFNILNYFWTSLPFGTLWVFVVLKEYLTPSLLCYCVIYERPFLVHFWKNWNFKIEKWQLLFPFSSLSNNGMQSSHVHCPILWSQKILHFLNLCLIFEQMQKTTTNNKFQNALSLNPSYVELVKLRDS